MQPAELAQQYFASVRARDIERFIALFADDAVMCMTDGREYSGRSAIREMELGVFTKSPPTPTPMALIEGDKAVAAEVEVRLHSGGLMRVVNVFKLNEAGRIQRLSVYRKTGEFA